MITPLPSAWTASFPEGPPLAHVLRRTTPDRWLRIHSLPDSKRYPEGPDDERELLLRHARVADLLLASGEDCALVLTYANGYRGGDEPPSIASLQPEVVDGWGEQWACDVRFTDDLEDTVFAAAPITYDFAGLTSLVLDVAMCRTASLLFFAPRTGRVYAPYDGGADLFFDGAAARDAARIPLTSWLSPRADGL